MFERYWKQRWWVRGGVAVGVYVGVLTAVQGGLIFPGAVMARFARWMGQVPARVEDAVEAGVEESVVTTADGERLIVWGLRGEGTPKRVAVVFHGNAGDVRNFFPYQQYLQSIGVTSYGFDYRGFGRSSGWPSEEGLYRDADAVVRFVSEREGVPATELLFFGVSIGTGPASYAAERFSPAALVLLSPYVSLPRVASERWLTAPLAPLVRFQFPVKEHVSRLKELCLLVVHGERDTTIPPSHGREVFAAAPTPHKHLILAPDLAHNDILSAFPEITSALTACRVVPER